MKKIAVVFGTRPEAIKMASVVLKLKEKAEVKTVLFVTGQHSDLLDQVLQVFGLVPDVNLELMQPGQTLPGLTARAIEGLDKVYRDQKPDLILAQGDTTTVFCATLAAFYNRIPVGHVEAGLRTGNLYSPWPEEANRVLTGHLAALHFAPTEQAKNNLLREGISADSIHVTGNTGIDTLFLGLDYLRTSPELRKKNLWRTWTDKTILITAHRRENFGEPFERVCHAIADLAKRYPNIQFVYPVHPNPNVRKPVNAILNNPEDQRLANKNIHLIDPLSYLEFVDLMEAATLILTDSGGVQEEAPSLGKPVLVLRDTTERPEAVEAGTVQIVGTDPDKIISETTKLLNDKSEYEKMSFSHNPYGDGKAANRIVNHCLQYFSNLEKKH